MSLDRTRLEAQLARAKDELGIWVKSLESQGVAAEGHRADPQWRHLNARKRQIARRLATVTEIERVNAECEQRKAEAASSDNMPEEPEPVAPKAKKEKKAKA